MDVYRQAYGHGYILSLHFDILTLGLNNFNELIPGYYLIAVRRYMKHINTENSSRDNYSSAR